MGYESSETADNVREGYSRNEQVVTRHKMAANLRQRLRDTKWRRNPVQGSTSMLVLGLLCAASSFLPAMACLPGNQGTKTSRNGDFEAAVRFLLENDQQLLAAFHRSSLAAWNYETNLTDENLKKQVEAEATLANVQKETWQNTTLFSWREFENVNQTIYRWFRLLSRLGPAALPEDKFKRFRSLIAEMLDIYSTARVCERGVSGNCTMALEPDLQRRLSISRDYDELEHAWAGWREASTRNVKELFTEYVELSNAAARLNGFRDNGEMWRDSYESVSFMDDVEGLWEEVEPLYKHLHAYVRRKLMQQYPSHGIRSDGPIPAHLLGNMWSQTWEHIYDFVMPYPLKKTVDVTKTMLDKNMTVQDMVWLSEKFFVSLGMYPMTQEFWNRSIFKRPEDRPIACDFAAWDMFDGRDFRIKECARVNMEDLMSTHHEMGHIQYFQQYAHLPAIFREGANQGFHEAVGDTLALSVRTNSHLKKIGLLPDYPADDEETDLNFLLKTALTKVAFLPYGYLIDHYRWRIFSGEVQSDSYNRKWWEMILKYQGLCPPVRRTENDFDAAAKLHVIADVPYIRYFFSYIIQFQFLKSLCGAAGHKGPLHRCDIYQSEEAGKLLSDTLRLGRSVHWSEAMGVLTRNRTRKMEARSLMEYFGPLLRWLEAQNAGETLGWRSTDPMLCPSGSRAARHGIDAAVLVSSALLAAVVCAFALWQ